MARPSDWTPLERWSDPVPGDPVGVSNASRRYIDIADSIADAKMTIEGIFDNDELKGDAIDAVREVAIEVAERIWRAHERYLGVGNALATYVQPLETAQRDSANLLTSASSAREDRVYAEGRVQHWQREYDDAVLAQDTTAATYAENKMEYWRNQGYEAHNLTVNAVNSLQTILDARDRAANRAADDIEQVENSGDLNDGFWENVDQWFEENPWINDVITWAGYIAAALAVIAMFVPGLNLIVGAIVLIVTIATVANAVLQGLSGNKPWGQALFEIAMAVIPFGIGKGLSKAFTAIAAKMPKQAVTSLLISSSRTGAGLTKPAAILNVADEIAKGPFAFLGSDIGALADIAQLAKMPLTSGNLSPALQALGSRANFLFGGMVATELTPSVVDFGMGQLDLGFGGESIDLQNHNW